MSYVAPVEWKRISNKFISENKTSVYRLPSVEKMCKIKMMVRYGCYSLATSIFNYMHLAIAWPKNFPSGVYTE